jgi:Co/Zn/Cd efflux system component
VPNDQRKQLLEEEGEAVLRMSVGMVSMGCGSWCIVGRDQLDARALEHGVSRLLHDEVAGEAVRGKCTPTWPRSRVKVTGSHCHEPSPEDQARDAAYRRVLWIVLALNAGMFLVGIVASLAAGSASLQADALDFFADAANYGISLFVVGMALRYRARAAVAKGLSMGAFGLWVLGTAARHAILGTVPEASTMEAVGLAALAANTASFGLLWTYRTGDANMRSVWLCSRNDVIANLAVLLAALGVFGTGTGWPDVVVAAVMASLALQGAWVVVRQSRAELRVQLAIERSPAHALRFLGVVAAGGSEAATKLEGPAQRAIAPFAGRLEQGLSFG